MEGHTTAFDTALEQRRQAPFQIRRLMCGMNTITARLVSEGTDPETDIIYWGPFAAGVSETLMAGSQSCEWGTKYGGFTETWQLRLAVTSEDGMMRTVAVYVLRAAIPKNAPLLPSSDLKRDHRLYFGLLAAPGEYVAHPCPWGQRRSLYLFDCSILYSERKFVRMTGRSRYLSGFCVSLSLWAVVCPFG